MTFGMKYLTNNGRSVYLRDLVDVHRSYVSPPSFLNFFGAKADNGEWRRSRGITIAIQMRSGQQIDAFGKARSAMLMALSISITLAMTFGMLYLLGIDLQQISIASLILALGLLVDDPVVAGHAIKRDLAAGHPRGVAA
jgi:hypothetical protein